MYSYMKNLKNINFIIIIKFSFIYRYTMSNDNKLPDNRDRWKEKAMFHYLQWQFSLPSEQVTQNVPFVLSYKLH